MHFKRQLEIPRTVSATLIRKTTDIGTYQNSFQPKILYCIVLQCTVLYFIVDLKDFALLTFQQYISVKREIFLVTIKYFLVLIESLNICILVQERSQMFIVIFILRNLEIAFFYPVQFCQIQLIFRESFVERVSGKLFCIKASKSLCFKSTIFIRLKTFSTYFKSKTKQNR